MLERATRSLESASAWTASTVMPAREWSAPVTLSATAKDSASPCRSSPKSPSPTGTPPLSPTEVCPTTPPRGTSTKFRDVTVTRDLRATIAASSHAPTAMTLRTTASHHSTTSSRRSRATRALDPTARSSSPSARRRPPPSPTMPRLPMSRPPSRLSRQTSRQLGSTFTWKMIQPMPRPRPCARPEAPSSSWSSSDRRAMFL
mmetsp:Transcript_9767/g.17738  ORF Transcript_9767/g.17738 Transcript_9767/m.17738 type:complete len:202 (+) Transcript_9767:1338-1943(+)